MVRAQVLSVESGAEYEERIYNYWVNVKLEDDSCLVIFDDTVLDLSTRIGEWVNCSISLLDGRVIDNEQKIEDGEQEIYGVFLDDNSNSPLKGIGYYHSFVTNVGVFYISREDILQTESGKPFRISASRFDLRAVLE